MPKDVQGSIEKFVKTPPEPGLFSNIVWLHEIKLRYIPVIEVSAVKGKCSNRKILEYLKSRVEVRRGRSQFETPLRLRGRPPISPHYHYFWPANVFELDEVKAELELMKSDSFLRLENEEDVKLVKEINLWDTGESNAKLIRYKDKWDRMSEEEKNRAIWEVVIDFVRHDVLAYEKLLEAYKKFGKFWFTFYYSD